MTVLTGLEATNAVHQLAPAAISDLAVKIFADGADVSVMRDLARNPSIKGFTTNPTLMRRAGVTDYRTFAQDALAAIGDRPISFEVISDDLREIESQAREVASWSENVYVKIPAITTTGLSTDQVIRRLAQSGIRINVTALLTLEQVRRAAALLEDGRSGLISVFAGRIADTGRDPVPVMAAAVDVLRPTPHLQLIWASPRELLNVFQADAVGCHIVTMTEDLLRKLPLVGKSLEDYSVETVRMFVEDGRRAGYTL